MSLVINPQERLQAGQDYGDWKYVFEYADGTEGHPEVAVPGLQTSTKTFDRDDVEELIGIEDGDNDGPDWIAVGKLTDGRFFSIAAGCDYTGWG